MCACVRASASACECVCVCVCVCALIYQPINRPIFGMDLFYFIILITFHDFLFHVL